MKFIRPTPITTEGSFARASTGTYYDSAGVLRTAAIDVPRIGYNPSTLAHAGLIVEGAATNLLTYSEQFNNGVHGNWQGSITPNVTTAPDGLVTADKFVENNTANGHNTNYNFSVTSGIPYVFSVFIKAAERTKAVVAFAANNGAFGVGVGVVLDTSLGTISILYGVPLSYGVQNCGNGWFRVHISGIAAVTTTSVPYVGTYTTAEVYTGDGTSGIFVWGAQMEVGSVATSYIPTVASTVTRAADVVTGTGLIYSNILENDYAAWNGATPYTLGDRVIRTTTHKVYEKVSPGTTTSATTPELDSANWLEVSPTNRWGALDKQIWSSSSATDKIVMILKPGRFNSIALLQLDAANVTVDLNVSGSTVYTASMNLTSGSNVGDWYQYFYEPVYQQDSLVITDLVDAALLDLPAYGEGILTVTISRTAATVSCGVLVVGLYANLGSTQYNPTIGIIDYSRKETDTFGNSVIVSRRYSKRMSAEVLVMQKSVDNVARLLAQYRTTPLVWVGADNLYTSMIIYGFYKDWEINIANPIQSNLSLQVEGLT